MKTAVRIAWPAFTAPLEGVVPYMYQDILGLITCAAGNLIDPISLALETPFVHKDGTPATKQEIADEWHRIKSIPELAHQGHLAAKHHCELRLTDEGIALVEMKRLDSNDAILHKMFPNFEDLPADAQMGIHSMAWAMGPNAFYHFPSFRKAIAALDFNEAAAQCRMNDEHNAGLRPRNLSNKNLFQNAAIVVARGLDPEPVYFPEILTETSGDIPDTQPSLAAPEVITEPEPEGTVFSPESDGGPISCQGSKE